jgi:hypothetical protein
MTRDKDAGRRLRSTRQRRGGEDHTPIGRPALAGRPGDADLGKVTENVLSVSWTLPPGLHHDFGRRLDTGNILTGLLVRVALLFDSLRRV